MVPPAAGVSAAARAERGRSRAVSWLSKLAEHSHVSEGVRLDVLEAEELRDALVVGAAQGVVGVLVDRPAVELDEAVRGEELGLEGQREQPGQTQLLGHADQLLEDAPAD